MILEARYNLVAIPASNQQYELYFNSKANDKGVLHRLAAVLYVNNWNIISAKATKLHDSAIEDIIVIESLSGKKFDKKMKTRISQGLDWLLDREISINDFLQNFPEKTRIRNANEGYSTDIKIRKDIHEGQLSIEIQTHDRPGLLMDITKVFDLLSIDIIEFEANVFENKVRDFFQVAGEGGRVLDERTIEWMREMLMKNI